MNEDVVVVSLGARTPLGLSAEAAAAAARAGIRRIAEHAFMVDPAGEPLMTAAEQRAKLQLVEMTARYYWGNEI